MGVTGVQAKLSALQSDFSDVSDAFAALGVRVDTDDTNARIAKATSDLAARLDSSAAALESKVASVETELSARIDGCVSDAASLEPPVQAQATLSANVDVGLVRVEQRVADVNA